MDVRSLFERHAVDSISKARRMWPLKECKLLQVSRYQVISRQLQRSSALSIVGLTPWRHFWLIITLWNNVKVEFTLLYNVLQLAKHHFGLDQRVLTTWRESCSLYTSGGVNNANSSGLSVLRVMDNFCESKASILEIFFVLYMGSAMPFCCCS